MYRQIQSDKLEKCFYVQFGKNQKKNDKGKDKKLVEKNKEHQRNP